MDLQKSSKVSIFGEIYSLISDESEQHLMEAARNLDVLMREVAEKSGLQDTKKIAVLVALRLSSVLLLQEEKAEQKAQQLQKILSSFESV